MNARFNRVDKGTGRCEIINGRYECRRWQIDGSARVGKKNAVYPTAVLWFAQMGRGKSEEAPAPAVCSLHLPLHLHPQHATCGPTVAG